MRFFSWLFGKKKQEQKKACRKYNTNRDSAYEANSSGVDFMNRNMDIMNPINQVNQFLYISEPQHDNSSSSSCDSSSYDFSSNCDSSDSGGSDTGSSD